MWEGGVQNSIKTPLSLKLGFIFGLKHKASLNITFFEKNDMALRFIGTKKKN